MRLLFIVPGFAAHEQDSTCIPPLQSYVRSLTARGADVHIIALEYPFHGQAYTCHGAQVYPCNGRNRWWLKIRTMNRAFGLADRVTREGRPALVHSFWFTLSGVLGRGISEHLGLPFLCTLMGQEAYAPRRNPSADEIERVTRSLISLSAFHRDMFQRSTGILVPQMIPWGMHRDDVATSLPTERDIDVLGVGSLLPIKDWENWIVTVGTCALQMERPLRAQLIGSGPERRKLARFIQRLGLEHVIELCGELPRSEVLERMRRARVLLHTSLYESFGYVLTEAAANGCHVVSTPVGIAPDMAECADTQEGLINRLRWALEREPLTRPEVSYPMEATLDAYWQLYEQTIGGE